MFWPKTKYTYNYGDVRRREAFAWLPAVVDEGVVWFERYAVKEILWLDGWHVIERHRRSRDDL